MNHPDQLDRILAGEDALMPSSGFAASVMDAIADQAAAPAPIPFPWKQAVPGIAALVAALFMMVRLAGSAIRSMSQGSPGENLLSRSALNNMLAPLVHNQIVPALLALAAALLCIMICRRLAAGSSLR